MFSNALLAVSLWTVKEWLLSQNVGAFWVLIRILACGALGLGFKEVVTGDAPKAFAAVSSAKVRNPLRSSPFCCFRFTDGFVLCFIQRRLNPLANFSGLC